MASSPDYRAILAQIMLLHGWAALGLFWRFACENPCFCLWGRPKRAFRTGSPLLSVREKYYISVHEY